MLAKCFFSSFFSFRTNEHLPYQYGMVYNNTVLLGPGPAAGKPAAGPGLAGAAPPPFFLAGLAGLRRHAEIFEFLNF